MTVEAFLKRIKRRRTRGMEFQLTKSGAIRAKGNRNLLVAVTATQPSNPWRWNEVYDATQVAKQARLTPKLVAEISSAAEGTGATPLRMRLLRACGLA